MPTKALQQNLINKIRETERFATDPGGQLYRYDNGWYQPEGRLWLARRVVQLVDSWAAKADWTPLVTNSVFSFVRDSAPLVPDTPDNSLINVRNKIVVCEAGVGRVYAIPSTPEIILTTQIPVDYDPSADCPKIIAFLREIWPGDAGNGFFEIAANMLIPRSAAMLEGHETGTDDTVAEIAGGTSAKG